MVGQRAASDPSSKDATAIASSSIAAEFNSPELIFLNDAIEALEEGVALYDTEMRFILCNDNYVDFFLPKQHPKPARGEKFAETIRKAMTPDHYLFPQTTSENQFTDSVLAHVQSHGTGMEFERSDGRFLLVSSKQTGLGGYLITILDITERKRAEQAERKATGLLNDIIENCPSNLLVATIDTGEILYRSPSSKELFGEKKSARSHWQNPEDRDHYVQTLMRDGHVEDMFTYGVKPDGTAFPAQLSARLIEHCGERVIISSTTDLTEMIALRAETEKANAALREGIEALDEGFVFYDEDLRFVTANRKYKDALAPYDHLMLPGTPILDIIGKAISDDHIRLIDDNYADFNDVLETLQTKRQARLEIRLPDNRHKIVTASKLNNGSLIATMLDITDQRDTENRAREMFSDILETLSEGVALYDDDERLLLHNSRYLELLNLDPTIDLIGTSAPKMVRSFIKSGFFSVPEGLTAEDHEKARIEQIRAGIQSAEITTVDGCLLASSSITPLGGRLITLENLTEQRRAEQTLVDAIHHLPVGVAVERPDGTMSHCNDVFASFYGRTAEQLQALSFDERMGIIYPRIATLFGEPISDDPMRPHREVTAVQRGSFAPIEASMKDGRHYLLDRAATSDNGRVVIMTDITALKEAEARSLAAFDDAIQSLDLALVLWDPDMKFVMANKKWLEYFVGEVKQPEVGDRASTVLETLTASGYFKVPDEMSNKHYADDLVMAMAGYDKRLPLETTAGRSLLASVHETGPGGYLISFNDITEQRRAQAELEQQRAFTHQNEKLLALGELLAGVAHELNNPLSIVVGYAQMLEGKIKDPVLARRVERISQAADRSAKIVRTFLAMARQRQVSLNDCSLNDIVRVSVDIAGETLRTNGTNIVLELDDNLPEIAGDEDQLVQVFTNLIVNAEHALEHKGNNGKLTLRTYRDVDSGDVVAEVCDNGDGIPAALQDRIFEPFFTTKRIGVGTGIGLAFCHRIVDSHGGLIGVESAPGTGARFFVHLHTAETEPTTESNDENLSGYRTECRVLVIDDEEDVAEMIRDLLQESDLSVSTHTNAADALHLIQNQTFDVILADFKMQGMNGRVFYNALLATAPSYKDSVGYITGDAMGAETADFFKRTGCPYIEKPIDNRELFKLVELLSTPKKNH
ncbi:MAG: PAS-domain containing protein [Stappiaceae bacterium]